MISEESTKNVSLPCQWLLHVESLPIGHHGQDYPYGPKNDDDHFTAFEAKRCAVRIPIVLGVVGTVR